MGAKDEKRMMRPGYWALVIVAAWLVPGCASQPGRIHDKSVRICSGGECSQAATQWSDGRLRTAFRQMMKANEGEEVAICAADPETRAGKSSDVCFCNGCAKSMVFNEIGGSQPGRST